MFEIKRNKLIMPLPRNDAELEILTEAYFGKALHLSKLSLFGESGSYEVLEPYDSYHGTGYEYGACSIDGYDHSQRFWNTAIGILYCGGIAHRSYGQFKLKGYRHRLRIQRWIESRRGNDTNYVRKSLVRLGSELSALREQNDS